VKKICVVTGTRAEYGLLYWLMKGIQETNGLELQVIATGMHLSPEFGLTYREIEKDGFRIDRKVEIILSGDTPSAISKSVGLAMIGFADALKELQPHIIIVLGDRFEIIAAAFASAIARIPVAHISGGETTLGALDEFIRHSITKMAWWHFVAAEEYQKRVVQLGENPKQVFVTGGMGVDCIKKTKLLGKAELEKELGFKFGLKNLLITFHPVTLERETSGKHCSELLDALETLENTHLIFTEPNADADSRVIQSLLVKFVKNYKGKAICFKSMGRINYLSSMQYVDAVVGNSSSGLAEAPSFKIGSINIGDRQLGRLKAVSVIDCKPSRISILKAIQTLYSKKYQEKLQKVINPYGDGTATEKILDVLRSSSVPEQLKKVFYDL
jgi:GDP/UDP-N,N'-diacetylbacillosamine 2-epimerase (hydrolysing)